jgi:hypothetical protein
MAAIYDWTGCGALSCLRVDQVSLRRAHTLVGLGWRMITR